MLNKVLNQILRKSKMAPQWRPEIFDLNKPRDQRRLNLLFSKKHIHAVCDDYLEQLKELFAVQNPSLVYTSDFPAKFSEYLRKLAKKTPLILRGRWIYYPWLSSLVHVLADKDYQAVRTARNRNLINSDEQKNFYEAVVGIGGLSVGNSAALAIVLQGGARRIRLADFDKLTLSNLNRIRSGAQSLGLHKVYITARQIYELNPYAKVEIFPEGLTPQNINKFFQGPPKLDIIIDELDNIAVKYLIRREAKRNRIAVVMGADNGDNAVIDVERYDIDPQPAFFHNRIGKTSYEKLLKLNKFEIGKTITKHIGPENVTERMQQSLMEMGKTIVSWPQLGGAALLNGSALALCVRRILNNQSTIKNRAVISLDEKLQPNLSSSASKKKRRKISQKFAKSFGL